MIREERHAHPDRGRRRHRRLFRRAPAAGGPRRDLPGAAAPGGATGEDRPGDPQPARRYRPRRAADHHRPGPLELRSRRAELQGLRPCRGDGVLRPGGGACDRDPAAVERHGSSRSSRPALRGGGGAGRPVPDLRHARRRRPRAAPRRGAQSVVRRPRRQPSRVARRHSPGASPAPTSTRAKRRHPAGDVGEMGIHCHRSRHHLLDAIDDR